jgi:hypothetical protein
LKRCGEEYDFTGKTGVRGKYAKSFKNGHVVRTYNGKKLVDDKFFAAIDGGVREYFSDSRSVNKALRTIISIFPRTPKSAAR